MVTTSPSGDAHPRGGARSVQPAGEQPGPGRLQLLVQDLDLRPGLLHLLICQVADLAVDAVDRQQVLRHLSSPCSAGTSRRSPPPRTGPAQIDTRTQETPSGEGIEDAELRGSKADREPGDSRRFLLRQGQAPSGKLVTSVSMPGLATRRTSSPTVTMARSPSRKPPPQRAQTSIEASPAGLAARAGRRCVDGEQAGKVFCLVEAPDAETAVRFHREAHRLVADRSSAGMAPPSGGRPSVRTTAPYHQAAPTPGTERFTPPDWSIDEPIYEADVRHYTASGTLREFSDHLPQLRSLGVGIFWLMPIFPRGEERAEGSPYAVLAPPRRGSRTRVGTGLR